MTLITRRQFIRQTGFSAAAISGFPFWPAEVTQALDEQSGQKSAPIDAGTIRRFASQITGLVITPDAPDYQSFRRVNNHAYDLHPAMIVRCASPDDVARTLDFGRSHKLVLAVRGGGHRSAGFGMCNGGVVIDLAGMKRVDVDAQKRMVRAQAGCLIGDVDHATQRFGLATVMGGCPTVGIGGLTLTGGLGTNAEVRGRLRQPSISRSCDSGWQATQGQQQLRF